ncbi:MAG TPA: glycoside hydrolase family 2 protein [Acetobacteraceae bacterium]
MARVRFTTGSLIQPLSEDWQCARTEPGAFATPDDLPALPWLAASVPGTFAAASRAAAEWNGEPPFEAHADDIWYRTKFSGGEPEILHFEGLATIAEVWLNGELLCRSQNMFRSHRINVRTHATNDLHICFRSLFAWLGAQNGRALWRPRLATPSSLRFARTTLLGNMPGWCPTVHAVGPWRPILRERRNGAAIEALDIRTAVYDREGRIVVRAVLDQPADVEAIVEVGGHAGRLHRQNSSVLIGEITLPDIEPWWPHTHGAPALHRATLRLGDTLHELGDIGFRHIEAHRDDDGFAVSINNEPVFCRGACWTTPDIVALPADAAAYRPWLVAMRDAGMNMVRVGGTMVYEADAFYDLCDELGLLVWQDAMLANFDYPATEAFRAELAAELADFFARTQTNASLAVFCGGSEVLQQAAMLGLPAERIDATLYDSIIPDIVHEHRPDVVYVANSPSGGALPFLPDTGVAHYYGVGAYLRPLDDARRANVRFASECLALANVPDARTIASMGAGPEWKRAVPRDPGAGWDFEDVRDHYLALLFGVDPTQLRWTDFPRYLDLSRAVSCILMEHVFAEWRRAGSSCSGGLVWQLQDLTPGAGWGVIDSDRRPKPAWHALRRAFRSRQVILTDEGLNGLHVHVINEAATPLHATLRLVCLKHGTRPVREASQPITVAARGTICLATASLLPGFFDITYAYRFGPPTHDVTVASLHDRENDTVLADAVHFPGGPALPVRDVGLEAAAERHDGTWQLVLRPHSFAQFLHIDDPAFAADDNWLHLPPNREKRITLQPLGDPAAIPNGEIHALNMDRVVRYAGRR